MLLTFIKITTLSINHIKGTKQIIKMHKATITQDIRGSPPAWGYVHQLFSSLLSSCQASYRHIASKSYSAEDRRSAHLARSSFPELGYNTKPLHSLLQLLALSLASLTQYAQSNYNYHLHLAHWPSLALST
jgi:hypothetical protein